MLGNSKITPWFLEVYVMTAQGKVGCQVVKRVRNTFGEKPRAVVQVYSGWYCEFAATVACDILSVT